MNLTEKSNDIAVKTETTNGSNVSSYPWLDGTEQNGLMSDEDVTCNICQKRFFNRFYLKKHRIECHKDSSNEINNNNLSDTTKQLHQNLNSMFNNSSLPNNNGFNPLLGLYLSKAFPNLPFPPNLLANLPKSNPNHILPRFNNETEANTQKLNHPDSITSTSTKIPSPSTTNYVSPFDAFKSSMAAAKLADRVTCDICHKDLCNKYFLRTHKLKLHGIQTLDTTPTNNNHNPVSNNVNNNNLNRPNHPTNFMHNNALLNNLRRNDNNNNNNNNSNNTKILSNPFLIQQNNSKNDSLNNLPPPLINATNHLFNPATAALLSKSIDNNNNNENNSNNNCICPICKRNIGLPYLMPIHLLSVHGITLGNSSNSSLNTTSSNNIPPYPFGPNYPPLLPPPTTTLNPSTSPTTSTSNNNNNNNNNNSINQNNLPPILLPPPTNLNDPSTTFNPLLTSLSTKLNSQNPFFPLSFNTAAQIDNGGSRWYRKSPNQMRVRCDVCDKWICNKYFLRTHKLNKHGLTESNGPASSSGTNSEIITPSLGQSNQSLTTSDFPNLTSSSIAIDLSTTSIVGCGATTTTTTTTSATTTTTSNLTSPNIKLNNIFSPARIIKDEQSLKMNPLFGSSGSLGWPMKISNERFNIFNHQSSSSTTTTTPLDLSFKSSIPKSKPKSKKLKLTKKLKKKFNKNKKRVYLMNLAKKIKIKYVKLSKLSKPTSSKQSNTSYSRNIFLDNRQPLPSTLYPSSFSNNNNNNNMSSSSTTNNQKGALTNYSINNFFQPTDYFSCPFCGKELYHALALLQHLSKYHEIQLPNNLNNNNNNMSIN